MKSILEELYFGNVRPLEISVPGLKEVDHKPFEDFENSLPKEQIQKFSDAINCVSESNDIANIEMFKYGFKLGFQIALEIFDNPDNKE